MFKAKIFLLSDLVILNKTSPCDKSTSSTCVWFFISISSLSPIKFKNKLPTLLKSIGVLNKSIIKIFFLIGTIIGTSATLFGIFLGVTFSIYVENIRSFISSTFDLTLFPEEIYFLSTMPSEIDISSIILISFCSILITVIVSIFPAMKAAKLDPIKSLKYE